jgi:hypothetical protein
MLIANADVTIFGQPGRSIPHPLPGTDGRHDYPTTCFRCDRGSKRRIGPASTITSIGTAADPAPNDTDGLSRRPRE